jgi:carbon starvation protein
VSAEASVIFAFAATFGAMAFSTFVFDTLDVSTRLGRYLLTELTGARSIAAGVLASGLTAGVPLAILLSTSGAGYMAFWTLFGTSNQLLAALTLLGVTVWLYRSGRRYWYTLLPMVFVFVVTTTALVMQIVAAGRAVGMGASAVEGRGGSYSAAVINGAVATALMALAAVFVFEAVRSVREFQRERVGVGLAEGAGE